MKPHDAPTIAVSLEAVWPGDDWLGPARSDGADAKLPQAAAIMHADTAPTLPRRIAMISDHASPLAEPGSIDCGGQNVYVAHLARELARAGVAVDIFTRRDAPGLRPVVDWLDGVRVIHVPAGPARDVPKEQMLPYIDAFARFVARFARRQPLMYDLVHANFFMSGMVAAHLRRTLNLPFVITFHALGQVRRLAQGAADGFPSQRVQIESGLMREAGRVIAECPQDRLDMEHLYDAPSPRIAVVPCGFSPAEFWPVPMREARQRLRIPGGRFVVLQLGRMVPRKGIDTVIQGVAMLRQRHGVDAELVIVGGDGPTAKAGHVSTTPAIQAAPQQTGNGADGGSDALDGARRAFDSASGAFDDGAGAKGAGAEGVGAEGAGAFNADTDGADTAATADRAEGALGDGGGTTRHDPVGRDCSQDPASGHDGAELARLRQLARELGIAAHVRFEGRQPRDILRDYYAAADVFASTPWYEPFGITPVEAMACARAVVGAGVGGIKNTVLDGITGYLVPPRDPEALADRLARLQRQPERAQRMGQLGRVRACEHYTWQRVAQQVMTVYTEVLEETRAAHRPAFLSSQESA